MADATERSTEIGRMGEFRLIDRLTAFLPTPGPEVVVGIGDDTAAMRTTPGNLLLATCDGQVEGVHFLRDGTPPRALGHRALAVNLSDVAAMGGRPRWALVALTLPPDLALEWLEAVYEGMGELARVYDVAIVGGNVARSPGPIVVDVTLLGDVDPARRLTRNGARPGDAIVVTGSPGASAAGLRLLLDPRLRQMLPAADADYLIELHRWPRPRIEVGRMLAELEGVTAAIDVSDGLAADLGHITAASGVGAVLDEAALPVSPLLRRMAAVGAADPTELVLHGGEAYELLVTCAAGQCDAMLARIRATGVAATEIGRITPERELRLRRADGTSDRIERRGHDHFAAEESLR